MMTRNSRIGNNDVYANNQEVTIVSRNVESLKVALVVFSEETVDTCH